MRGKVVNDPVHGFIQLPYGLVFDVMQHPYMQRLRRISQLGMSSYVYPGGTHTRFHHALGAMHLMRLSLDTLRQKGVAISDAEHEGALCAILLHDVGHGPFSHALEHALLPVHHETLTEWFMEALNETFEERLTLAIAIFKGEYERPFFHQLMSGQLDMDRMDYLARDSFYTGVVEGNVGYDRIIKMLDVRDEQLVVEEKGLYSLEHFLHARRLMYWQVYLHKAVIAAENMLIKTLEYAKTLATNGTRWNLPLSLEFFLYGDFDEYISKKTHLKILQHFSRLDDVDLMGSLKIWSLDSDPLLSFLAQGLLERRLFKTELQQEPIDSKRKQIAESQALRDYPWLTPDSMPFVVFDGQQTISLYNVDEDPIRVLCKNGQVISLSEFAEISIKSNVIKKYYLCFPRKQ
jgi:uncharacterized protein